MIKNNLSINRKFKSAIVFIGMILLISCVTMQEKESGISVVPKTGFFNPKSNDPKYNTENFDINYNVSTLAKVKNWTIEIMTSEGERVFYTSEYGNVKNSFVWDGKTSSLSVAPDGNYYASMTINYVFGDPVVVLSREFAIDTVKPSVNIKLSTDMFSPGLVGKKDDVTISQENANKQAVWNGIIYNNSGVKIKNFLWQGEIPKIVVWDGRDDSNKILPDGTYYYQVTASDRVGNYFESEKFDKSNLKNFKNQVRIFTKDILINISADLESFNPLSSNQKYNHQTFELKSNLVNSIKILNWKIDIINSNGDTAYSFSGEGDLKPSVDWNGKLASGELSKNDDYYALLSANFNSGSSSIGKTKIFSIDTVMPTIQITPKSNIFSPNSDGNLDTYDIIQKGSKQAEWIETINDSSNKVIWTKSYNGLPVEKESWDGKDSNGKLAANGIYKYAITGADKAGNTAMAESNFELKNEFTSAFLTLSTNQFASSIKTLKITPSLSEKDNIDKYNMEILDDSKNIIRSFHGSGTIPEFIEWHGLTDSKTQAPDGEYTTRLTINYTFGNVVQTESRKILLHNAFPDVSVKIYPALFAPDNDGVNDKLTIDIKAKDITGIKSWMLSILNPDKNGEFMKFSGAGEPKDKIVWDGKSEFGQLVDSANDYPVIIKVENNVGVVYQKELEPIHVDILVEKLGEGRYRININNILFKPDTAILFDSTKDMSVIKRLTTKLLKFPEYNISVEGYVNPFVIGNFNQEVGKNLSEKRAQVVAKLLDEQGISIKRMTVIGKGGDNPIVLPNDKANINEGYLEKNRRVEFYLNKK